jgi:hypothetical protein
MELSLLSNVRLGLVRTRRWLARVLCRLAGALDVRDTDVVLGALSPAQMRMRMRTACANCHDPYHREDGQCDVCQKYDKQWGYGDFDPRFSGRRYWGRGAPESKPTEVDPVEQCGMRATGQKD